MKKFLLSAIVAMSLALPAFAATELTDETVDQTVQAAVLEQKSVVIVFYADWCPSCQKLAPMLDKAEKAVGKQATFYKVNVDKAPRASAGIQGVPFFLIINGKTGQMATGAGLPPSQEEFEKALKAITK